MSEQYSPACDPGVVRRPRAVRSADMALRVHSAAARIRHCGDTMIAPAETLAATKVGADVRVSDPDGASWSITITAE